MLFGTDDPLEQRLAHRCQGLIDNDGFTASKQRGMQSENSITLLSRLTANFREQRPRIRSVCGLNASGLTKNERLFP
jgi:hypothetical protein